MTVVGESSNRKWHWIIAGVVVLWLVAMLAIAVSYYNSGYTMMYYPGFFIFPFGFFAFPFFWVFILFFFWPWGRRHRWDAREITKARYARGEITREQFEQIMRDLDQHGARS